MKKIIVLSFTLFSVNLFSQELSFFNGTWHWQSKNGKNSFELYLSQNGPTTIEGYHCSIFYEGKKVDCAEDAEECSINLTKVGENTYQGTIKSGFGSGIGNIKLTYGPIQEKIHFELLTESDGEFYLPEDVYLEK